MKCNKENSNDLSIKIRDGINRFEDMLLKVCKSPVHLSAKKINVQSYHLLKRRTKVILNKQSNQTPMDQLVQIQQQIEANVKYTMSDHELFLWKIKTLQCSQAPIYFNLLTVPKTHCRVLTSRSAQMTVMERIRRDVNFPILSCQISELISIGKHLMLDSNQYCAKNFSCEFVEALLTKISTKYNIVSYHNFTHAFSLFMMLFQCREMAHSFGSSFSPFEFFCAYIAALCHDLNHAGLNSAWHIKNQTDLAICYNNHSVLENMHVSQMHKLMKQNNGEVDVFGRITDPTQREQARKLVTQLILATDMHHHRDHIHQLQQLKRGSTGYSLNQKQSLLEAIFHACDIGNPCLEFENYMNWSLLLSHEFDQQAEMQKAASVEQTPDFEYYNQMTFYRRQLGFINCVAYPLWKQVTSCIPQLAVLAKQIQNNKERLQKMVLQEALQK